MAREKEMLGLKGASGFCRNLKKKIKRSLPVCTNTETKAHKCKYRYTR